MDDGGNPPAPAVAVKVITNGGVTTVTMGGTVTLVAWVTNATSSAEVTWKLTGPTCPAACGTITRTGIGAAEYVAPSPVTADVAVTITATSVQDPSKSDSVRLTVTPRVCPTNASLLQGKYAFLVQGFTTGGAAVLGSVTADGCGGVIAGEADVFLGPAQSSTVTSITGSYSIGDDRRGTVTLSVAGSDHVFAFAVGGIAGGIASRAALTDFSTTDNARFSGGMWRQDAGAFDPARIDGPYAFLMNGWGPGPVREAMGGVVEADGYGHLGLGFVDEVVFQGPVTSRPWDGLYGAPSSNGRMTISSTDLAGTGSVVAYVVDAGQFLAMLHDATTGRVVSGQFLAQEGAFGQASLSGNGVAHQTANYTQFGYEVLTTSVLTLFQADGAGTLTLTEVDQNYGGNAYHASGVVYTYTYTVAGNGQATIWDGVYAGGRWYLTAPNAGFMLGFDPGRSVGRIFPQADRPFSVSDVSGTYLVGQAPGGSSASTSGSGVATSSGTGTLEATMDLNAGGGLAPGVDWTSLLTMEESGRATDANGNVLYVVSPDLFFLLNLTTADPASVVRIFER